MYASYVFYTKKTNLWVGNSEDQIESHRLQLIKGDRYIFSRWKFKPQNQNQGARLIAAELATGTEKKLWCSQCHGRLNSLSDYRITEWLELEETAEGHLVQHPCSNRTTSSLLPKTMLGFQVQQQVHVSSYVFNRKTVWQVHDWT